MDKRIGAACERLSCLLLCAAQTDFTFVSEEIVGGEIKQDRRVIIWDAQNKHTHYCKRRKRCGRTQLRGATEENNNVTGRSVKDFDLRNLPLQRRQLASNRSEVLRKMLIG